MKPVFLCGFMGCGKSTVGRILARNLGVKLVDLDNYIEQQEGMKISQIFEKKGEAYFRALETKALKEFKTMGGVVATGGGTLLTEENGNTAKESGVVVFLDVPFNVCYGRIKGDKNRPIAYNSTREQLEERYNTRRPLYEAHSNYKISGSFSPYKTAEMIRNYYNQFQKIQ